MAYRRPCPCGRDSICPPSIHHDLVLACLEGNIVTVRSLLDSGANPAFDDNLPLRSACVRARPDSSPHFDTISFLLDLPVERGVDPSACRNVCFSYACSYANIPLLRLLLSLPPQRGVVPRSNVLVSARIDVVRLLLESPHSLDRVSACHAARSALVKASYDADAMRAALKQNDALIGRAPSPISSWPDLVDAIKLEDDLREVCRLLDPPVVSAVSKGRQCPCCNTEAQIMQQFALRR